MIGALCPKCNADLIHKTGAFLVSKITSLMGSIIICCPFCKVILKIEKIND